MLVGCSGSVGRPHSRLGSEHGGTNNGEANGPTNGVEGSDDGGTRPNNVGEGIGAPPLAVGEVQYPCPAAEPMGVIHYVCDCGADAADGCVAGNDANSGATPDAPFRTFEKARTTFGAMAPGETIAFCRGGSFTAGANSRWTNARCRADKRCIVRDYKPLWGREDKGAPIINVGSAERIFSLENGGDPTHEEGYVFANLSLRGTGTGTGLFFFNDIDDVLVCSNSFDRLAIGVHTEGSLPGTGDVRQARIVVRGNRFTNSGGFGYLGGCDECVVEDNYFANNGTHAIFDHNLYLHNGGNGGKPFMNVRVTGNELYQSTMVDGKCQGASLVVHGLYDNLLVENNYVHEDVGAVAGTCWGIAVTSADTDREGFNRTIIRSNRVENLGSVFIGVNSCANCVIEDNVLINTNPATDLIGIQAPNFDRDDYDLALSAVTVRNNSLYFAAGTGVGIYVSTEGNEHVVTSNAIHFAGTAEFACFDLGLPKESYRAVDNNLCFFPKAQARWENKAGSLSNWVTTSGFDKSSASKDPGFTSLIAPFNLAAASAIAAMVDKGHATQSSPMAINGKLRVSAPDIGAYEH
jgi:hypothetical protein